MGKNRGFRKPFKQNRQRKMSREEREARREEEQLGDLDATPRRVNLETTHLRKQRRLA